MVDGGGQLSEVEVLRATEQILPCKRCDRRHFTLPRMTTDHPLTCLRAPIHPQAKPFTLWRAVVDALAASMLVTCLLDFWRIGVGGSILSSGGGSSSGEASTSGLPWMP